MDSVLAHLGIDAAQLAALQEEITARTDPEGRLQDLAATTRSLVTPDGRLLMGLLGAGDQVENLARLLDGYDGYLRVAALSLLVFPPRGWAFSGLAPVPAYNAAIKVLESQGTLEDAEDELVRGWSTSSMLDDLSHKVSCTLVPRSDEMWDVCSARGDLVGKAWEHHKVGAYEASIPIALSQAEGLVLDALGKGFFTKKTPDAEVVDDRTLAGLNESLASTRRWFSGDVRPSQIGGSCSRHGIMHGRELGYATEPNSVRCFVLLAAIYEFAQPRLQDQAKQRHQDSSSNGQVATRSMTTVDGLIAAGSSTLA